MIYNGKNFYTVKEFIKWCFKEGISTVETQQLLREYWKQDNVTIGNMLEWYYKEE